MAELYLTCNSGSLYSPAFVLEDPTKRLFLAVPSLSVATAAMLQFSQTSGAGPYLPLTRQDGTATVHTVASGPGPAFAPLPPLPTPWGRISFANSQTLVTTLAVYNTPARW